MEQSGKNLSLLGDDRWKGGYKHNGSLLKLHDFSFTAGYSKLTGAVGVPVKFGYGAWYDASLRDNAITTVKPTGGTTVAVFAGILARQPHIASGYPTKNDTIDEHNKGLLVKEGFLVYKTGHDATTGNEDKGFADVRAGFLMCINDLNGKFVFAASAPVGHTAVGKIIMVNPDDRSWTVKLT
jgi:hypothetical protein